MKHLMLMLIAVFFLVPLTAVAEPDPQPVSLTDEEQAHYAKEAETATVSASEASVKESSSAEWQDSVHEIERDTTKEDNLEEVREAVAEDILLNK